MKNIFWDMDNTLLDNALDESCKDCITIEVDELKFYSKPNEPFISLMKELRDEGYPTFLLTTATRDLTLKSNEVYNFGFKEDEIYAREDFLNRKLRDYSLSKLLKTSGVLIDNDEPISSMTRKKKDFIGDCQYIRSPYFSGVSKEQDRQQFINFVSYLRGMIKLG